MHVVDQAVEKRVSVRNIKQYKKLGIKKCGVYKLHTSDLFKLSIRHDYIMKCSSCNNQYTAIWDVYKMRGNVVFELCGKCRSKSATDKMIKTTQSDNHRNKMREIIKGSLNDPDVKLARNKASEKRKNGWCKTNHAKSISVSNLKHFSGEDHPKWNPNKDDFQLYKNKVLKHQSTWDLNLVPNYDENKRFLCGVEGGFQLDHIVSQKYGYDNDVHPYYIGHICNLQFITWEENRCKHHNNSKQEVEDMITSINKIDQCVSF